MDKVSFNNQLAEAISKYSDRHVDVIVSEQEVYGIYHSESNSFSVTDTFSVDSLGGIDELMKLEEQHEHLCVCID